MSTLFKTTIVIYSDFNPFGTSAAKLAADAIDGDSFLAEKTSEEILCDADVPEDVLEFFGENSDNYEDIEPDEEETDDEE